MWKEELKYDRIKDMPKLITLCHPCHMSKYAHTHMITARLTEGNKRSIRTLRRKGRTYSSIAAKYNVSFTAVYYVVNRRYSQPLH